MITTAILLAAGRGERLRPLTDDLPKCLIPVNHKPLISYHIEKLAMLGIKNIIINISYLAEKIQSVLQEGSQWGVNIQYSYEPEPLETGGGIRQALPLLKSPVFLVISSDIYTDYDFSQLIHAFNKLHQTHRALAHILLVPNPDYHQAGDFALDQYHYINHAENNHHYYTYANIGVFSRLLFDDFICENKIFGLGLLMKQYAQQQKITGEIYTGLWHNIGTMREYEKLLTADLFRRLAGD